MVTVGQKEFSANSIMALKKLRCTKHAIELPYQLLLRKSAIGRKNGARRMRSGWRAQLNGGDTMAGCNSPSTQTYLSDFGSNPLSKPTYVRAALSHNATLQHGAKPSNESVSLQEDLRTTIGAHLAGV